MNLEVADSLEQLGRFSEAIAYYQNALENNNENVGHKLICYSNMASAYIKEGIDSYLVYFKYSIFVISIAHYKK